MENKVSFIIKAVEKKNGISIRYHLDKAGKIVVVSRIQLIALVGKGLIKDVSARIDGKDIRLVAENGFSFKGLQVISSVEKTHFRENENGKIERSIEQGEWM